MPSDSIFNTMKPELDPWRQGERLSARKLNQSVDALRQLLRAHRNPQQVRRPRGGGDVTTPNLEVKIVKAIEAASDAADMTEMDRFDQYGEHLRCARVMNDQSVNTDDYIVVFPIFPRVVSDFKQGALQVFNAADPQDPHFFAINGSKGRMLRIGEARDWTIAPDPSEVC